MPSALVRHRILMLDPAPAGLGALAVALARSGHDVAQAPTAEALIAELAAAPGASCPMDLLVVRLAGPPRSGLELLRRIRRASPVPCILVPTLADDLAERVMALELGADDYWHRAMPPAERLARVQALLRRAAAAARAGEAAGTATGAARPSLPSAAPRGVPPLPILFGGWRLLPQRRLLVAADGRQPIRLTGAEFELLRLLALAGGEPVERDVISRAVFRRPWRLEDRAVDGLVKRLRRKLEEDAIATVRGVGYALMGAASATLDAAPPGNRPLAPAERSSPPMVENCGRSTIRSPRE
jgi:DNA-binding response OmpR family regulator